tara:strand:- start:683 stop:889 length:207 start_codon:yes stop_codon:yes gene_type:complete
MYSNLNEDDLRFILEAAKETAKSQRECAYNMIESSESPQEVTNMFNKATRLERALDNIERSLDKTYFE